MAEQQLWLFSQPKPLQERLGDEFFRKVPPCPGVYIMRDRQERVIYVGQSGNLRRRLNCYKNVRPEKHPRKLVRLAQAATTITCEACDTPAQARLRENELLRLFRPKFNKVNTHPESYGFIGLSVSNQQIELWLTDESNGSGELFGAFKGSRRYGYGALLRLLFGVLSPEQSPESYPPRLHGARPPRRFLFSSLKPRAGIGLEDWHALMRSYLDGSSSSVLDCVRGLLPAPELLPPFWQQVQELDLQTAEEFFQNGPQRNRRLREENGLGPSLIAPEELDDLIVLSATRSV